MKMYIYEFILSDGTKMNYKTQGLFTNTTQDEENRVLIKSALIVGEFEADEKGNEIVEAEVEQEEVGQAE